MCDSKGVIYKGRKNIDQFKSAHAIETKLRTLDEAMKGADVFLVYLLKMLSQSQWLNLCRIIQLYLHVQILIQK